MKWLAWTPYRDTADGTIDTLLASPHIYASKSHAYVEGGNAEGTAALCGAVFPRFDDCIGWHVDAPRGFCLKCLRIDSANVT